MKVTIIEIDGSEGIIIPQEVLDSPGVKFGDTLDLRETSGGFGLRRPHNTTDNVADAIRLSMKVARTELDELRK